MNNQKDKYTVNLYKVYSKKRNREMEIMVFPEINICGLLTLILWKKIEKAWDEKAQWKKAKKLYREKIMGDTIFMVVPKYFCYNNHHYITEGLATVKKENREIPGVL